MKIFDLDTWELNKLIDIFKHQSVSYSFNNIFNDTIKNISFYQYINLFESIVQSPLENIEEKIDILVNFQWQNKNGIYIYDTIFPSVFCSTFTLNTYPSLNIKDKHPINENLPRYISRNFIELNLEDRILQLYFLKNKILLTYKESFKNVIAFLTELDEKAIKEGFIYEFKTEEYYPKSDYGSKFKMIINDLYLADYHFEETIDSSFNSVIRHNVNQFRKKNETLNELNFNYFWISPLCYSFAEWKKNISKELLKSKESFTQKKALIKNALTELSYRITGKSVFEDFYNFNVPNLFIEGIVEIIQQKEQKSLSVLVKMEKTDFSHFEDFLNNEYNFYKEYYSKNNKEDKNNKKIILSDFFNQDYLLNTIEIFLKINKINYSNEERKKIIGFIYRISAINKESKNKNKELFFESNEPFINIPKNKRYDFIRLFIYLSQKGAIISTKTDILEVLSNELHQPEQKDLFGLSTLKFHLRGNSIEFDNNNNKALKQNINSILDKLISKNL